MCGTSVVVERTMHLSLDHCHPLLREEIECLAALSTWDGYDEVAKKMSKST